ncbi:MAG TPA: sigma-70 family RNA polymerase sigma factor [Polyangiaceae bacterium]|jgi:RNA polymerase sigma-70 factor (ECF subfamily)
MAELAVNAQDGIVDDCRQGDELAWRELHRRFYPVAAAFLRKLGVGETDLDDATQEVFLELFRYLPGFRGDSEFKTWLYRLCITQARRARRRASVTSVLLRALSLAPPERLVSAPSFSENHALRRVHAALSQLGPLERETFTLFEMEGVSGKDIAEIMNCPEATVWRRLCYARRAFRRALGADEG